MNADAITALKRAISIVDEQIAGADVDTDEGAERLEWLSTDRYILKRGLADLEGNAQQSWNEMEIFVLFDKWCASQTTARAAAKAVGCTPQYLCDMRAARRRLSDAAIQAMGYRRKPRDLQLYVKMPEKETEDA